MCNCTQLEKDHRLGTISTEYCDQLKGHSLVLEQSKAAYIKERSALDKEIIIEELIIQKTDQPSRDALNLKNREIEVKLNALGIAYAKTVEKSVGEMKPICKKLNQVLLTYLQSFEIGFEGTNGVLTAI